jgi:hypothetical protein
MGCCGQGRTDRPTRTWTPPARRESSLPRNPEALRGLLLVEYSGQRAIRVTGPATGRRYTFPARGAQAWVDERDAPGVLAVARLRAVR